MKRGSKAILSVAAIAGAFVLGAAADAQWDQPHMSRALEHLQAARAELAAADRDKGGYRKTALRHIDAAIEATRRGMQYDRRH